MNTVIYLIIIKVQEKMKTFKIALIRKLFSYLNVQVNNPKFENFLNLFHGQT